jgi:hypothetical protein
MPRFNARQGAGICQIIKQTLHMGHLFLSVTTQKRSRAFETVEAAPGAHLLVEQGRKSSRFICALSLSIISVFSIVALLVIISDSQ